jgi:hypothetical protein
MMHIQIVGYALSVNPKIQALVDVLIDDWLRVNGLNYCRDGTLGSAQLTWQHNARRHYRSSIVIEDADLRELVLQEINVAFGAHIASLREEQRMLPPRPPKPRPAPSDGKPKNPPPAPRAEAAPSPVQGTAPKPVKPAPAPLKPSTTNARRVMQAQTLPHRTALRPPVTKAM